ANRWMLPTRTTGTTWSQAPTCLPGSMGTPTIRSTIAWDMRTYTPIPAVIPARCWNMTAWGSSCPSFLPIPCPDPHPPEVGHDQEEAFQRSPARDAPYPWDDGRDTQEAGIRGSFRRNDLHDQPGQGL